MWLFVSISAYFINAGVYVADKFLLSKKVHSSITYTFYVGIWSIFNLVLLFFDPWIPGARELCIDLLAGLLFLATLVFWYKALHQSDATRVVPIVGALIPVFSLLFSYIFLGTALKENQIIAFIILIIGGILISVKHTRMYYYQEVSEKFRHIFGDLFGGIHAHYRSNQRLVLNSIIAALFFSTYYILMKNIYSEQPFVGAFVWSRMGSFLGVILILFIGAWRKKIAEHQRDARKPKNLGFFIGVRLFAVIAFIMLNYAISLDNVAIINALQGTQYIFLIFLILFLSKKHPKILKEELGRGVMLQKVMGALLIGMGLYMLVV